MRKSFGLLVLAGLCGACLTHARPRPTPERLDPVVGDLACAPPRSIEALLATLHEPLHEAPPDDAPVRCERG